MTAEKQAEVGQEVRAIGFTGTLEILNGKVGKVSAVFPLAVELEEPLRSSKIEMRNGEEVTLYTHTLQLLNHNHYEVV